MYAIVDCDNCFVSCERVFQPQLRGKAVVVLSNNDGCVVARSNEAKALGIKMGTPFFQLASLVQRGEVLARSSNYALYADMSNRVMSILSQLVPHMEIYSIDEAFLHLHGMYKLDYRQFGLDVVQRIGRWTGMPVSVGIAPTKTLAKVAVYYAKHYAAYQKVCVIDDEVKRTKALQLLPIDEVWGVGRRFAEKMRYYGIGTAWEFTQYSASWIRKNFTVTGLRVARELMGEECVAEEGPEGKKTICTSRSFPELTSDVDSLRMYVSNFAAHCAAKLRAQHSAASLVTIFVGTNPFREDLPQYMNAVTQHLVTAVNDTFQITQAALLALEQVYREGYKYKRAGCIVSAIGPEYSVELDLFDTVSPETRKRYQTLSKVMDSLNRKMGDDTIRLGIQQYPHTEGQVEKMIFKNSIRHDYRSKCYTTNFNDLIEVK